MKFFLPFGDWSDDGHGKYEELLVEAPSMEHLLNAQKRIKEKYGEHFFCGFAEDYNEPTFMPEIWQALIDTNYPIENFKETEENNDWDDVTSLTEALTIDPMPLLCLEFVKDAFIWLLNAFGAEIRICTKEEQIPMICNWTCQGFETVGYGCFYN